MHCTNCGKELNPQAVACPACGVPPRLERKFCRNCGGATQPNQTLCKNCGSAMASDGPGAKDKLVAGLLGIFLGSLGIHKFYLGYNKQGLIMLLVTLLTCGMGAMIVSVIGLIEGILYLTKTDEEFSRIYVEGRKEWF